MLGLAAAAGLAAAPGAGAASLQDLVSPGSLIHAHAELESDCDSCHRAFEPAREDALCLECHEEIAADRVSHSGFHGRAPGILGAACRSCHTEHEGRDADVVGLDPATFEHEFTDYPLRGAHLRVACQKCHAAGKKHREAPSACVDCHRQDDPHRERLGESCGDCHDEAAWANARFDHAATDFALNGAHREVDCALCHADERYEGTPADCSSCHRLDDVHAGSFGSSCSDCHSVDGWSAAGFDHDRTRFPLRGDHRGLACSTCHTGDPSKDALALDCQSCHAADDVHRGANSADCKECHDATGWARIRFDHARDTGFPLRGAHEQVRCQSCHEGVLYESETAAECVACHRKDDVHGGQQGEACQDCHTEQSWREGIAFDHQLSGFPLLGLHAAVSCEECHATHAFQEAEVACVSCHRPDDIHRQRLGENCATCHNPNGWGRWRFDHTAQTSFALHGAHEEADCVSCHSQPVKGSIELSHECVACHAIEDVHRGAFGRTCGECHAETSWSEVEIRR